MRICTVFLFAVLMVWQGTVDATDFSHGSVGIEVVFSSDEIRIIRAYYETQSGDKHHQKDKHKRKRMPPGIAKNLARGKPLPPGLAKTTLPFELRQNLPPVADGYERIIVDGKLLLIEIATQTVRDLLIDVILD